MNFVKIISRKYTDGNAAEFLEYFDVTKVYMTVSFSSKSRFLVTANSIQNWNELIVAMYFLFNFIFQKT